MQARIGEPEARQYSWRRDARRPNLRAAVLCLSISTTVGLFPFLLPTQKALCTTNQVGQGLDALQVKEIKVSESSITLEEAPTAAAQPNPGTSEPVQVDQGSIQEGPPDQAQCRKNFSGQHNSLSSLL